MNGSKTLLTKIWDLPIRVFHWLLVISLIGSLVTVRTDNMELHIKFAMLTTALLSFRILWGFCGSSTALLRHLIPTPKKLKNYFSSGDYTKTSVGHSPLGAMSVIAMLLVIVFQLLTGLVADDDIYITGPLADYVSYEFRSRATTLHVLNAKLILGLVSVHILAILAYRIIKKDDLIRAMITGKKRINAEQSAPNMVYQPISLVICILLSLLISYSVFYLI